MKVYLIRHGEKQSSSGDPSLTKNGVIQAERIGRYFIDKNIDAIYSSPLKRAQETARIISVYLKKPVLLDKRLRERINWGDIPGQIFKLFLKEWDKQAKDREYVSFSGLSSYQAGDQIEQFMSSLDNSLTSLALISHGGVIRDYILNISRKDNFVYKGRIDDLKSDPIPECSITALVISSDAITLVNMGETADDLLA